MDRKGVLATRDFFKRKTLQFEARTCEVYWRNARGSAEVFEQVSNKEIKRFTNKKMDRKGLEPLTSCV